MKSRNDSSVNRDLHRALRLSWTIISLAGLLLVLAAFCLPEAWLLAASPRCYSVVYEGRECFMCGSTRAFVHLGNGSLKNAWAQNRLAPFLFLFFSINAFALLYYVWRRSHFQPKPNPDVS